MIEIDIQPCRSSYGQAEDEVKKRERNEGAGAMGSRAGKDTRCAQWGEHLSYRANN